MSSRPAIFILLLLTITGWPGPAPAVTGARVALVIGNAKYESEIGPLRNTVRDAEAMGKTLKALGFTVIEEHNVTRDDLLKALVRFQRELAGAEVGLFYYAGHGISVRGSNYLVPIQSDYRPEGLDAVTLRLLAETRLFNVEQAVADMSASGVRCNLIILDACRTTSIAGTGATRDLTDRGGLAEMTPPAGSLIAFATDAGQTALDGEGKNGLYTEELLRHMRTPGLTLEQVFKRTRAGVLERSDGQQIPAEYSRLIGEDIYLAGEGESAAVATIHAPEGSSSDVRAMKALPLPAPSLQQIQEWADERKVASCVEALIQKARLEGSGSFAVVPLETLLDQVKDDLKRATDLSIDELEAIRKTCDQVLEAVRVCIPRDHEKQAWLAAKALNRRGDSLLTMGLAEAALGDYETALKFTPDDGYILYNRGQAHLELGRRDAARADFSAASDPRLNQAGARKLALEALKSLDAPQE